MIPTAGGSPIAAAGCGVPLNFVSAIIPALTPPTSLQQPLQQHNSINNSNSSTPNNGSRVQQKNPKLYKTELCRSWMENGRCNYGERCQYAHGEREKRPVPRHPKYKTEPCQSYHKTGYCPYGPRCHFIHNESPSQLKVLIAANENALRMIHELAFSGRDSSKKSLITSQSAVSLGTLYYSGTGTSPVPGNNAILPTPYLNTSNGMLQKNNTLHNFSNGHNNQFLGKAQSFSNNAENNFSTFLQQQTRQSQQHHFNNLLRGMNHTEDRNFCSKNNWCNNDGNSHFCDGNDDYYLTKAIDHQRPKTLDLFSDCPTPTSPTAGSKKQFLSFFSAPDARQLNSASPVFNFTKNILDNENEKFSRVVTENTFIGETGCSKMGQSEELNPQQMLTNLCASASDDEFSRSSIVSSNVDSGNESPLAPFDEETLTRIKKMARNSQQKAQRILVNENGKINADNNDEAQQQQRRSSDGDTTNISQGTPVPVCDEVTNNSTASSSMASLLSSSSSSQHQQKILIGLSTNLAVKKAQSAIQSSEPLSSNETEKMPPAPTQSTMAQKIRLPVFERLSLNQ